MNRKNHLNMNSYKAVLSKETIVWIRNRMTAFFYKHSCKPAFFRYDPEDVHDRMTAVGRVLGSNFLTQKLTGALFRYANPMLEQDILGIHFNNPIGLSAGFDKDAFLTDIIPEVGFGFEEIGSITGEACEGNPRPRLWRLPKSEGLVVYYGLKNRGCEEISRRLRDRKFRFPIGISIAKTNCFATAETEAGIADYFKSYKAFAGIGDYYTVNISCPNAFGGEPFSDKERLEKLLSKLETAPADKPVFLKISPDMSEAELDEILKVASQHKIDGFICTNLTKKREGNSRIKDGIIPEKGGISGKVVEELSNKFIADVYKKTHGKNIIVGVGGIFTAEDAYKKIRLGASLLQLITGMIFKGPQVVSEINQGLVKLLRRDGFKNISETIGADNRFQLKS